MYVLWATASHKCIVIVAYNIRSGKSEGLQTQYQQLNIYCQSKNIGTVPKHLFCKDSAAHCGKWRKGGDRLIVIMDANKHTMDGKLRKNVRRQNSGTHIFLSQVLEGGPPPNTYINGTIPNTDPQT